MAALVIRTALLAHMHFIASVSLPLLVCLFMVIRKTKWCQRDLYQLRLALPRCILAFKSVDESALRPS